MVRRKSVSGIQGVGVSNFLAPHPRPLPTKLGRGGDGRGATVGEDQALFIEQPAIGGVTGGFVGVDDDGFSAASTGGEHLVERLVVRGVVAGTDGIDEHLHATATDQAVVPAVVAIELERHQLGRAFGEQCQRAAFDFGFDAAAAECSDLRAIGEDEHCRTRLLRRGTARLDECRVTD